MPRLASFPRASTSTERAHHLEGLPIELAEPLELLGECIGHVDRGAPLLYGRYTHALCRLLESGFGSRFRSAALNLKDLRRSRVEEVRSRLGAWRNRSVRCSPSAKVVGHGSARHARLRLCQRLERATLRKYPSRKLAPAKACGWRRPVPQRGGQPTLHGIETRGRYVHAVRMACIPGDAVSFDLHEEHRCEAHEEAALENALSEACRLQ